MSSSHWGHSGEGHVGACWAMDADTFTRSLARSSVIELYRMLRWGYIYYQLLVLGSNAQKFSLAARFLRSVTLGRDLVPHGTSM